MLALGDTSLHNGSRFIGSPDDNVRQARTAALHGEQCPVIADAKERRRRYRQDHGAFRHDDGGVDVKVGADGGGPLVQQIQHHPDALLLESERGHLRESARLDVGDGAAAASARTSSARACCVADRLPLRACRRISSS